MTFLKEKANCTAVWTNFTGLGLGTSNSFIGSRDADLGLRRAKNKVTPVPYNEPVLPFRLVAF